MLQFLMGLLVIGVFALGGVVNAQGATTGKQRIAAGAGHALVTMPDGSVWAWGYNGSGQVGDGTTVFRAKPVRVIVACVCQSKIEPLC